MNQATVPAAAQLAGGAAVALLLVYGGMALATADAIPLLETLLWLALSVLLVWAALWSLPRVAASRAAGWIALLVVGVAPVAAFLGWFLNDGIARSDLFGGVLWLNLLVGLLAGLLVAWSMFARAGAPATRRRVARID